MKNPKIGDRVVIKYKERYSVYDGFKGTIIDVRPKNNEAVVKFDNKCMDDVDGIILYFENISKLRKKKKVEIKSDDTRQFVVIRWENNTYTASFKLDKKPIEVGSGVIQDGANGVVIFSYFF